MLPMKLSHAPKNHYRNHFLQFNYSSLECIASETEELSCRRKEDEADLRIRLQKVLCDIESEAKDKLQKLTHDIVTATESKLDQRAEQIQEKIKFELNENASAILEETQMNLNKKTEVIETSIQNALNQKQVEVEKKMEKFLDSKTTGLKEVASASLAKIEVCTDNCLAKLSNFTEMWLTNSCNVIANRLRPFLFPSSECVVNRDNHCDTVIGQATDVHRDRSTGNSLFASTNSDRLKRKLSTQLDPSVQKSSFIDGEVSTTQDSKTKASRRSRVEKLPSRPLRRSKRTKSDKNLKHCNDMNKRHHQLANRMSPNHSKKESLESPLPVKNKEMKIPESTEGMIPLTCTNNGKALCVTPTVGNSQPRNKVELADKPTSCNYKEVKDEPKTICPPESSHRKRRNTRRPSTMKPSETESHSSKTSVPFEVFTFNAFQLSPLEDPDLLPLCGIKRHSKTVGSGSCSVSKKFLLSGKRRRNAVSRTYKRRKNCFDVTDNCTFNF